MASTSTVIHSTPNLFKATHKEEMYKLYDRH